MQHQDPKSKASRRKSAEFRRDGRYNSIEHDKHDDKIKERFYRKAYGKIGESFKDWH